MNQNQAAPGPYGPPSPEYSPQYRQQHPSNVRDMHTGITADVRGLTAICLLDEALCKARDLSSIECALASWAKDYAECDAVEFLSASAGQQKSNGGEVELLATADGRIEISVPLHTAELDRVVFRTRLAPERMTDSLRRIILVAGRICASQLARLELFSLLDVEGPVRKPPAASARPFLGISPAAEKFIRMIPKLTASAATVLLMGETGVGKTFVARLIHESGPREQEPFRVINCASIPENLIESELFGHERGSFTGAVASRAGAFEAAGWGTVLLDEVGELPLPSQAKLLRALEEKRFERIGSNRSMTLHARIITATNRDLEAMVAAGTFRSDLFFRISVVKMQVPPLRERRDDLPMLAEQILADLRPTIGRSVDGFSPQAFAALCAYSWPGNVRELRNSIEHALVFGEGRFVEAADFPATIRTIAPSPAGSDEPSIVQLPARLEWLERRAIEEALRVSEGNRARAAELLGIKPATLYYKLRQVSFRDDPG